MISWGSSPVPLYDSVDEFSQEKTRDFAANNTNKTAKIAHRTLTSTRYRQEVSPVKHSKTAYKSRLECQKLGHDSITCRKVALAIRCQHQSNSGTLCLARFLSLILCYLTGSQISHWTKALAQTTVLSRYRCKTRCACTVSSQLLDSSQIMQACFTNRCIQWALEGKEICTGSRPVLVAQCLLALLSPAIKPSES